MRQYNFNALAIYSLSFRIEAKSEKEARQIVLERPDHCDMEDFVELLEGEKTIQLTGVDEIKEP